MQIKTIDSSKLEWEIFPNDEGGLTYCADGDGFVTLEQAAFDDGTPWWTLNDQGSPVGEIGTFAETKTLAEALEIAQDYLAATYNEIFQNMRFDK
jgi:hypothetical protein